MLISSCSHSGGSEYDIKVDTFIIDSVHVDERTELIYDSVDTIKKKSVTNQYPSKCVAYRIPRIS